MTEQEAAFVEAMGQYLGSLGMTPMAGRVWGYLLICDPPEQTAEQIATALHASRGAISGTVRLLEGPGFIRRSRRPADRREYFSSPPGTIFTFAHNAGEIYRRLRVILERGLEALSGKPPPLRRRLEEAHDLIAHVEQAIPAVLEDFVAEVGSRSPEAREAAS